MLRFAQKRFERNHRVAGIAVMVVVVVGGGGAVVVTAHISIHALEVGEIDATLILQSPACLGLERYRLSEIRLLYSSS